MVDLLGDHSPGAFISQSIMALTKASAVARPPFTAGMAGYACTQPAERASQDGRIRPMSKRAHRLPHRGQVFDGTRRNFVIAVAICCRIDVPITLSKSASFSLKANPTLPGQSSRVFRLCLTSSSSWSDIRRQALLFEVVREVCCRVPRTVRRCLQHSHHHYNHDKTSKHRAASSSVFSTA